MKSTYIYLIAITLVTACTSTTKNESRVDRLPFYNEATFTPQWLEANDEALKTFHSIPPFSLTNQNGEEISEKSVANHIYVVDFFFTTCPGICPKMTSNMMAVQEAFLNEEEVLILSHSVTPKADSVPVLAKYAEDKGIVAGKWHLLTGSQQEIYRLGRKEYFVEEDLGTTKKDDEFLHTENFVLIDKNRHIRGLYNGLKKSSVKQLIADIKTLQEE